MLFVIAKAMPNDHMEGQAHKGLQKGLDRKRKAEEDRPRQEHEATEQYEADAKACEELQRWLLKAAQVFENTEAREHATPSGYVKDRVEWPSHTRDELLEWYERLEAGEVVEKTQVREHFTSGQALKQFIKSDRFFYSRYTNRHFTFKVLFDPDGSTIYSVHSDPKDALAQPWADFGHYKFRAECLNDVIEFLLRCPTAARASRLEVDVGETLPEKDSDPVVELETMLTLEEIRSLMGKVEDGHVMYQTVQPVASYTGERDHNVDLDEEGNVIRYNFDDTVVPTNVV